MRREALPDESVHAYVRVWGVVGRPQEAFRHAGKLQGICTLSGFLAAYLVKLIDD